MRKSHVLLFLGASMMLAGCGNDESSWNYNPDDFQPATTLSYELEGITEDKTASLLISHLNPDLSKVKSETISIESSSAKAEGKAKTHKDTQANPRGCSLLREQTDEVAKIMYGKMSKNEKLDVLGKVNTKYTDCAIGGTVVVNSPYTDDTPEMEKMYDGTGSIIFAQVVKGKPVIDAAQAASIDKMFSTENPYDESKMGIGPRVRGIFGSEWKASGGKDGTEKVVIFVMDSSQMGDSGSDIYGCFAPYDCLDQSDYEESNMGEILYLNSKYLLKGDGYDLYSTVAHEFQHMCNYNQKYIHDGAFDGYVEGEMDTINEGQSVLAEDLTGFNLDSTGGGNSYVYKTASSYMASPENYDLFSFSNSLGDYGKGYLLMRYIADRFNVSTIKKIATSKEVDFANISSQTGVSFDTLFTDWGLTNTIGSQAKAGDDFRYTSIDLNKEYIIRTQDAGKTETKAIGTAQEVAGGSSNKVTAVPYTNYYLGYNGKSGGLLDVVVSDPTRGTDSCMVIFKGDVLENIFDPERTN